MKDETIYISKANGHQNSHFHVHMRSFVKLPQSFIPFTLATRDAVPHCIGKCRMDFLKVISARVGATQLVSKHVSHAWCMNGLGRKRQTSEEQSYLSGDDRHLRSLRTKFQSEG